MAAEIRKEFSGDYETIRDVHIRAFGGDSEANLVELLRDRKKALIALVALIDDRVVGHIMFSPVAVAEAPENFRGIGLAPVSVLPQFQNQGIGSKLVHAGLVECRQDSYDAVFVLGHTKYYPRFGFRRAKDFGLDNEYKAENAFMVMELKPEVLGNINGLVKYAPEFRETGC